MSGRLPWPSGFSVVEDPDVSDTPRFAELLGYWQSKRGERQMPRRSDIDPPLELARHADSLVLIEVVAEADDFRYRLIGTQVVARHGRDSTGMTARQLYENADPVVFDWTMTTLRTVVDRRGPVRATNRLQIVQRDFVTTDQLLLPLADDADATVKMILCEVLFHPALN